MTQDELFEKLKVRFAGLEKPVVQVKSYLTLKTPPTELLALITALKADGFDYLDMVTAVDWKGPVEMKGYITDPNPNFFLPEGATAPEEPPTPTPGVPYRDAMEVVYLL